MISGGDPGLDILDVESSRYQCAAYLRVLHWTPEGQRDRSRVSADKKPNAYQRHDPCVHYRHSASLVNDPFRCANHLHCTVSLAYEGARSHDQTSTTISPLIAHSAPETDRKRYLCFICSKKIHRQMCSIEGAAVAIQTASAFAQRQPRLRKRHYRRSRQRPPT
jgi:hypothetical protein